MKDDCRCLFTAHVDCVYKVLMMCDVIRCSNPIAVILTGIISLHYWTNIFIKYMY